MTKIKKERSLSSCSTLLHSHPIFRVQYVYRFIVLGLKFSESGSCLGSLRTLEPWKSLNWMGHYWPLKVHCMLFHELWQWKSTWISLTALETFFLSCHHNLLHLLETVTSNVVPLHVQIRKISGLWKILECLNFPFFFVNHIKIFSKIKRIQDYVSFFLKCIMLWLQFIASK